mmetsp:Transcript_9610/g.34074  ORF Transcript_9610/g.34074 Transcript_9610/m.34074 type:complete len:281 (-) Transcript_9610:90-932(-)
MEWMPAWIMNDDDFTVEHALVLWCEGKALLRIVRGVNFPCTFVGVEMRGVAGCQTGEDPLHSATSPVASFSFTSTQDADDGQTRVEKACIRQRAFHYSLHVKHPWRCDEGIFPRCPWKHPSGAVQGAGSGVSTVWHVFHVVKRPLGTWSRCRWHFPVRRLHFLQLFRIDGFFFPWQDLPFGVTRVVLDVVDVLRTGRRNVRRLSWRSWSSHAVRRSCRQGRDVLWARRSSSDLHSHGCASSSVLPPTRLRRAVATSQANLPRCFQRKAFPEAFQCVHGVR